MGTSAWTNRLDTPGTTLPMDSIKKQARRAGLLYLLACITAPFALVYVPGALLVPGDATATADRIRASETLLRLSIASELIIAIFLALAVLALYHLFRRVSEKLALAMAALILISIPIQLANVLNHFAPLILTSGAGFLSAFGKDQLDALAYLFLRLHNRGLLVSQVFWGLWLFPYGILVMRSGFIPGVLGVVLMIAGAGYLASSFTSLLLPQYAAVVSQFATVLAFGEVPMLVWLLWGGRGDPVSRPSPT